MTEPKKIHPVEPSDVPTFGVAATGGDGGSGGGVDTLVSAMVTRATIEPDYLAEKTALFEMTESYLREKHSALVNHKREIQNKGGVLFARLDAEKKESLKHE